MRRLRIRLALALVRGLHLTLYIEDSGFAAWLLEDPEANRKIPSTSNQPAEPQ